MVHRYLFSAASFVPLIPARGHKALVCASKDIVTPVCHRTRGNTGITFMYMICTKTLFCAEITLTGSTSPLCNIQYRSLFTVFILLYKYCCKSSHTALFQFLLTLSCQPLTITTMNRQHSLNYNNGKKTAVNLG